MTALTEHKHAGSCIISTANGNQSFENVTLVSGQSVQANAVLGKITSGGKYAALDVGSPDGRAVAYAISLNACDATAGDTACAVIARDAEVIADELVYASTSPAVNETTVATELAARGILVRS